MAEEIRSKNSQLKEVIYTAQSDIHGTGVFAQRVIQKGDYIGTYAGPEASRNGTYVLWLIDPEDEAIGRSGRNLLRYLNHSIPGNAEFDGFDLYARVRIECGEEITFNYEPEE